MMNERDKNKKSKQEPDLAELSEKCPLSCGCEKGCAVDDAIFYEAALLDDYRKRLRNESGDRVSAPFEAQKPDS
jgi:hypothetical protein